MQKSNQVALGIFIGVIAVGGGLYAWKHPPGADVSTTTSSPPVAASAVAEASPASARYPLPDTDEKSAKTKLPSLNESDATFEEELNALFGKAQVKAIFNLKDLIRRIVVTAANAKEADLPLDDSPINPAPDYFMIMKQDGLLWIDPKNQDRYAPYVSLVQGADMKKVAAIYFEFYPLFQSAYREIDSKGYFNDLAIKVVDHLLSTPDVVTPIQVLQMNKSYHYADPNTENLSGSQKLLIRMGKPNADHVKEQLRKLRNLLILGH
jgi:hypothetical protein